jgi:hypothetical protein
MVENLRSYLNTGLIESESKNTSIKRLARDTCHEFIEWVGLVKGTNRSDMIVFDKRIFKDELYMDFVQDNPDFAPKAKKTISRVEFYRWLQYYGEYKEDVTVSDGRSNQGRWIIFETNEKKEEYKQEVIAGLEF